MKHAARQERRADHTTDRDRRAAALALSDKTAGARLLDPAEQKTKGVKSDTPSLVPRLSRSADWIWELCSGLVAFVLSFFLNQARGR